MGTLNKKILINSYPRSGSTTLMQCIRMAAWKYLPQNSGIFFHEDDWVIRSHIPLAFMGRYPDDVVICTIVRNPLDCITSNVYRWSKGYTGNIVNGKLAIDANMAESLFVINEELLDMIDHQVKQYISYLSLYLDNSDRIMSISHEAIQDNIEACLDLILPLMDEIDYLSAMAEVKKAKDNISIKDDAYVAIRRYVGGNEKFSDALDLYNRARLKLAI